VSYGEHNVTERNQTHWIGVLDYWLLAMKPWGEYQLEVQHHCLSAPNVVPFDYEENTALGGEMTSVGDRWERGRIYNLLYQEFYLCARVNIGK